MNMQKNPFIFSNQWKYRLTRHIAFWLFWAFFQGILYASTPATMHQGFVKNLPAAMVDSFIYLIVHIFFAYSLMYFVIPKLLLKQKYWLTGIFVSVIIVTTAVVSALLTKYAITPLRISVWGSAYQYTSVKVYNDDFYKSLLAGLRGGLTIGGMAAAIKLMKHWYIEEQRNLQLQKENIESQLQLLKAQVHPHFLFNTLNNIYSYTQKTSPIAAKMVSGLSDMLRFILYEANQSFVPLSKELRMVQDYINLEQIRYGNKLEIHINLPEETYNLHIAPLLLLPLVENCFKHGASNILENPWINLDITLTQNKMQMKLINGKPTTPKDNTKNHGIGISNVEKRLMLLYPHKHEFMVTNDIDVFIVNLKVELEQRKNEEIEPLIAEKSFEKVYA